MTEAGFLRYLAQQVRAAGSQRKLAHQLKISAPYISQVLLGKRPPSVRLIRALGLKKRPLAIDAA